MQCHCRPISFFFLKKPNVYHVS